MKSTTLFLDWQNPEVRDYLTDRFGFDLVQGWNAYAGETHYLLMIGGPIGGGLEAMVHLQFSNDLDKLLQSLVDFMENLPDTNKITVELGHRLEPAESDRVKALLDVCKVPPNVVPFPGGRRP